MQMLDYEDSILFVGRDGRLYLATYWGEKDLFPEGWMVSEVRLEFDQEDVIMPKKLNNSKKADARVRSGRPPQVWYIPGTTRLAKAKGEKAGVLTY